jgi:AraC-like DNA-binding protein
VSVRSRELVDVDRVRADAFVVTDELRPHAGPFHTHALHQVLFASDGLMRLETDAGLWLLPPHRAAWLRAGVRHRVDVERRASLVTLYHRSRFARGPHVACIVLPVSPLLEEMMLAAKRHGPRPDPRADAFERASRRAMLRAIVGEVAHLSRELRSVGLPRARSEVLRRATTHVLDSLAEADLASSARAAAVSPRTLHRLFAAELGMGFREWQHLARMQRAVEMLTATDRSIAHVASTLGFASPSAFAHAFGRFAGQSPRAYAQAHRTRQRGEEATFSQTAGAPMRKKTG